MLRHTDPSNDPETAEAVTDFFYRILPKHSYLIFEQPAPIMEHIFMFILGAFRGRDQLPKLVAADFLVSLVSPIHVYLKLTTI